MFKFKKTYIYKRSLHPINLKTPLSNIFLKSEWDIVSAWFANLKIIDPFITASRYFHTFLRVILSSRQNETNFWVSIQEDLRRRVLNVGRDNLLIRYRHVFPKNYLTHSYINEALYIAFFFKDLRFLTEYLKYMFRDVNFFKHRYLIYFLRAVFNDFDTARTHLAGSRGLFIKFKGKIAQAGNSRKKRFMVGCGQISTSQNSTYEIEKFQIKTFTGAIGCTIVLASE